jgi:hypothetical protein
MVEYITGFLREPLLILEAVIVLLGFEFGGLFLYRYIKHDREKTMILAWGLFFVCFGAMVLTYLFTDFVGFPLDTDRLNYIKIGYAIMGLGALIFTFNAEREIGHNHHILSLILLGAFSLMVMDFFLPFLEPFYFTIICWAPFVVILLFYLVKMVVKIKEYRLKVYAFFIGFLVLGFGYVATTDKFQTAEFLPRLFGDCSVIIGMSLISLVFVGLPSLKEVDWAKKLNLLLILHKSGLCICDYDFKKLGDADASAKKEYLAGGLIGVSQIVTEMVKNMASTENFSRLEVVDHQDKQIIFAYGEYLIAALVVDEYLQIYRKKLYHLIREIELLYGDRLSAGEDQLIHINAVEKLIKQIFS